MRTSEKILTTPLEIILNTLRTVKLERSIDMYLYSVFKIVFSYFLISSTVNINVSLYITYKGVHGHKFSKTPESFENNSELQVRLELMTLRVPVRSDTLTTSRGSMMSRVEI